MSPFTSSFVPTIWQLSTCGYSRYASRSSGTGCPAGTAVSPLTEHSRSAMAHVKHSSLSCRRSRSDGSSSTPVHSRTVAHL